MKQAKLSNLSKVNRTLDITAGIQTLGGLDI